MNLVNDKKDNQKAEEFRARGCQDLQKGKLYDALLKFNKSLCFAETQCSKTFALVYAKRAEIYMKLDLYKNCLNNIELARNNSCPKDELKLLSELEEVCLNKLNDSAKEQDDPWEFFKLSHPANENLKWNHHVADCLEVKRDKKFGRYIVSSKSLSVGDIISIEEPFFKILKTDPEDSEYPESNIYQYCANCLNDNFMDLTPCLMFCTQTMFCSADCEITANKGFHQYECQMLAALNDTGNRRMSLRCFFDALTICDDSIVQLEMLMRESDKMSPTVFNYDMKDCLQYKKNQLMCMLALESNVDVGITDLSNIFKSNEKLSKMWSTHKSFINEFLTRMMQIEILNFHGIKGKCLSSSNPYRACVGDGGYIFSSLINHSCCPNTMRIVVNNRMVIIVERPIKKGDQIFDCYIGDSFYFKSRSSRREQLMDYQFECDCAACENDFPEVMTGELNPNDQMLHKLAQKAYGDLRDPRKVLSPDEARVLAIKYSAMLQENYREELYPNREIVLLQLCIIKCFLVACKSSIRFP